jgi:predicted Zn-dependent protease
MEWFSAPDDDKMRIHNGFDRSQGMIEIKRWTLLGVLLLMFCSATQVESARALPILRDAETETVLRGLLDPLLVVNRLNPQAVRLFVVNAIDLNAFVADGQQLFMHAGLLMRAETADQAQGVMAHEVGHMVGGHLALRDQVAGQAGMGVMATYALAAAAGVLSGNAGASSAILLGGQQAVERRFLSFSRAQESAADASALSTMDALQLGGEGLLSFFRILEREEQVNGLSGGNPYQRSHPLTPERSATIASHQAKSPYAGKQLGAATEAAYARVRGKLRGFLLTPEAVTALYAKQPDEAVEKRYALAIAAFRRNDLDAALAGVDRLLQESPRDPYYWELRGQMLYENGRVAEAETAYRRALGLKTEPLIQLALVDALIAQDDMPKTLEARGLLRQVVLREGADPRVWRQLAVVEGRLGHLAASYLALAEQALREGKPQDAKRQAQRVLQTPIDAPAEREIALDAAVRQRAQDILALKTVVDSKSRNAR